MLNVLAIASCLLLKPVEITLKATGSTPQRQIFEKAFSAGRLGIYAVLIYQHAHGSAATATAKAPHHIPAQHSRFNFLTAFALALVRKTVGRHAQRQHRASDTNGHRHALQMRWSAAFKKMPATPWDIDTAPHHGHALLRGQRHKAIGATGGSLTRIKA
jgi:hypothetical protein